MTSWRTCCTDTGSRCRKWSSYSRRSGRSRQVSKSPERFFPGRGEHNTAQQLPTRGLLAVSETERRLKRRQTVNPVITLLAGWSASARAATSLFCRTSSYLQLRSYPQTMKGGGAASSVLYYSDTPSHANDSACPAASRSRTNSCASSAT